MSTYIRGQGALAALDISENNLIHLMEVYKYEDITIKFFNAYSLTEVEEKAKKVYPEEQPFIIRPLHSKVANGDFSTWVVIWVKFRVKEAGLQEYE